VIEFNGETKGANPDMFGSDLWPAHDDVPVDVDTPVEEIEIDGSSLALPAEGDYDVIVRGADFSKKAKDGSTMFVLSLECVEEPLVKGKLFLVASPKARWRFNGALRALGLEPPTKGSKVTFKVADFIGKKLRAQVKHGSYKGEDQIEFGDVSAPPEGAGYRAFDE